MNRGTTETEAALAARKRRFLPGPVRWRATEDGFQGCPDGAVEVVGSSKSAGGWFGLESLEGVKQIKRELDLIHSDLKN